MIHVTQNPGTALAANDLNTLLNERISLSRYTEFVHSEKVLAGFMLILQNIFAGLMLAFVASRLPAGLPHDADHNRGFDSFQPTRRFVCYEFFDRTVVSVYFFLDYADCYHFTGKSHAEGGRANILAAQPLP